MTVHRIRSGFTLVEILIAVVILGILAAIVIPQFTNASESAKASSLVSQLQTIRSQLELYQVQHNGMYPVLDDVDGDGELWDRLTMKTDVDGNLDATGDYGPYLQQPPVNPFEDSATFGAGAGDGVGWVYVNDGVDGSIYAVMEETLAARVDLDTQPNDVITYAAGG